MKLLVTGGRNYTDTIVLNNVLDRLHSIFNITLLIEGGAFGADRKASNWAANNDVVSARYTADWNRYQRSAGVIRNRHMFEHSKPDIVVAFPGGSGTNNMVSVLLRSDRVGDVLFFDFRKEPQRIEHIIQKTMKGEKNKVV